MKIAFTVDSHDATEYYEVDAEFLAEVLDYFISVYGNEVGEVEAEFEEDELEYGEDDFEYDENGTAWWFCEEDEIWYYFDDESEDWVAYVEDESEEVYGESSDW